MRSEGGTGSGLKEDGSRRGRRKVQRRLWGSSSSEGQGASRLVSSGRRRKQREEQLNGPVAGLCETLEAEHFGTYPKRRLKAVRDPVLSFRSLESGWSKSVSAGTEWALQCLSREDDEFVRVVSSRVVLNGT